MLTIVYTNCMPFHIGEFDEAAFGGGAIEVNVPYGTFLLGKFRFTLLHYYLRPVSIYFICLISRGYLIIYYHD